MSSIVLLLKPVGEEGAAISVVAPITITADRLSVAMVADPKHLKFMISVFQSFTNGLFISTALKTSNPSRLRMLI